jgi:phage terminase small subunit
VQALRDELRVNGQTYECRGRLYPSPCLPALAEASRLLHSGLSTFGLTPSDRSRLHLAERKPESKFELLQMRAAKQSPPPAG